MYSCKLTEECVKHKSACCVHEKLGSLENGKKITKIFNNGNTANIFFKNDKYIKNDKWVF